MMWKHCRKNRVRKTSKLCPLEKESFCNFRFQRFSWSLLYVVSFNISYAKNFKTNQENLFDLSLFCYTPGNTLVLHNIWTISIRISGIKVSDLFLYYCSFYSISNHALNLSSYICSSFLLDKSIFSLEISKTEYMGMSKILCRNKQVLW